MLRGVFVRLALVTIALSAILTSAAAAESNPQRWFQSQSSAARAGLFGPADDFNRDSTNAAVSKLAMEAGFYLPLEHAGRLDRSGERDYFLHGTTASPGGLLQASYMELQNPAFQDHSIWLVNLEPLRFFELTGGPLEAELVTADGERISSVPLTDEHELADPLSSMRGDFSGPEQLTAYRTTSRKLIFSRPGLTASEVRSLTVRSGEFSAVCHNWTVLLGGGPPQTD